MCVQVAVVTHQKGGELLFGEGTGRCGGPEGYTDSGRLVLALALGVREAHTAAPHAMLALLPGLGVRGAARGDAPVARRALGVVLEALAPQQRVARGAGGGARVLVRAQLGAVRLADLALAQLGLGKLVCGRGRREGSAGEPRPRGAANLGLGQERAVSLSGARGSRHPRTLLAGGLGRHGGDQRGRDGESRIRDTAHSGERRWKRARELGDWRDADRGRSESILPADTRKRPVGGAG